MSNYTDTFRKPAMTDETGIAIAEKLSGDTASEYKVNTSAEFRKAPMSDETAREILAKIDGGGSGASALSELSDVNLTSPSDGQVLHYDGTEWINATPVAELPAVTSDDNGDVLTVVEGTWAKATPSGNNNTLVVTFTKNNNVISCDTSIDNIVENYLNGKTIYAIDNGEILHTVNGERLSPMNIGNNVIQDNQDNPMKGAMFGKLNINYFPDGSNFIYYSAIIGTIKNNEDFWEVVFPEWDMG